MHRIFIACLIFVATACASFAQTAQQVVPGALLSSGCPSTAVTPCFFPAGGGVPVNITTATSTLIHTGAGLLLGLSVNTAGAGSAVTIYDGTTSGGTKIGTFSSAAVGGPVFPIGGIQFLVGLFVVTAGGTPADVTVIYH